MAAEGDVIVVGGGASGMMAAIWAARQGCRVTVLEKEEKPGRKLLATGNGKCNFTNEYQSMDCYYTQDREKAAGILGKFDEKKTVDFFRELGIYPMVKNGYYYPHSGQAESLVRLFLLELSRLGVKVKCKERVRSISGSAKKGFCVETDTYTYQGKRLILAAGGRASSVLGSDGSGYELAKGLGHSITKLYPGLTGLVSREPFFSKLSGVRAQAELTLFLNGTAVKKEKGEVQLAAYGLSGIPVFQLCRVVCEALEKGEKTEILVDFLPELAIDEFLQYIEEIGKRNPGLGKKDLYAGMFDKKLAQVLAGKGICGGKALYIPICGSRGFDQAQVTAGGIPLGEICVNSMESEKTPGVYLTGELLDVDGVCGGYNLQWAWSTGYLAGFSAGKSI